MEEWLRPKKREIAKKKPQEELDAEALAHPTPVNLELRKAAKQRLREKAEATLALIGGNDTDATAATDPGTDGAAPAKGKKPATNGTKKPRAKKPVVKSAPESEEEPELSSESEHASPAEESDEDVKPPPRAARGSARSGRKRKEVSYAEAGAESDVSMQ